MADEAVPWMIGGGVRHSVEVCRLLAYAAFNGDEGIIGSKDLEVRELSPPGSGVRVFPGACSVLNRGSTAAYDAYAVRFPTTTNVSIAATSGTTPRSDLIIARVENPFQSGEPWSQPSAASIADGTAVFRRIAVVSGVPATTRTVTGLNLGYSAIPLARVTLPGATGTVQQAHITDLRRLNSVRSDSDSFVLTSITADGLTQSTMTNWPLTATTNVDIPAWATHFTANAVLGGIQFGGSGANNVYGIVRLALGPVGTASTNYNMSNAGGVDYTTLMAGGGRVPIPASMRGTTQALRVQGYKSGGNTFLLAGPATTIALDIRYLQQVESNV